MLDAESARKRVQALLFSSEDASTKFTRLGLEIQAEALDWVVHYSSPHTPGTGEMCRQHIAEIEVELRATRAALARLGAEGGRDAGR